MNPTKVAGSVTRSADLYDAFSKQEKTKQNPHTLNYRCFRKIKSRSSQKNSFKIEKLGNGWRD